MEIGQSRADGTQVDGVEVIQLRERAEGGGPQWVQASRRADDVADPGRKEALNAVAASQC